MDVEKPRNQIAVAFRQIGNAQKVVVNVATKPGISIVLALVVPTTKPWMASVAVPRNVTGISAGTTPLT